MSLGVFLNLCHPWGQSPKWRNQLDICDQLALYIWRVELSCIATVARGPSSDCCHLYYSELTWNRWIIALFLIICRFQVNSRQCQITSSHFQAIARQFQVIICLFKVDSCLFQVNSGGFQLIAVQFQVIICQFQVNFTRFQINSGCFQVNSGHFQLICVN